jgi:hypothetical protein
MQMIRDRVSVYRGVAGDNGRRPHGTGGVVLACVALAYAFAACIGAAVVWRLHPEFLVEAPAVPLLIAAVTVSLAFACGGQCYVHHRFSSHDFVQHNEVGGFIVSVAGTLYAVVLGFLTVVAWQHFNDARQKAALEAAAATDAWHAAVGLPIANRMRVREDMFEYASHMLKQEWPAMRVERFDKGADVVVMDAISAAGTFKPVNFMQSNSQNATLAQLGVLHDARLLRLSDNAAGLDGFEWLVLVAGALCVVGFCWVFGLSNQSVHLIMTSTIATLVTALLVLLFELQYPFRSDLRISPASWVAVIDHIHMMQTGMQKNMR